MRPSNLSIKIGTLIFLLWTTCGVQGAPTWVSSNVPSSGNHLHPLGVDTDNEGELLTTFYSFQLPSLHIVFSASTKNGEWEAGERSLQRTSYENYSPDRLACFDHQGTPHVVLVHTSEIEYATKSGGAWTREHAATSVFSAGIAIALDGLDNPHIAYVEALGGVDSLYHGVRQSGVWTFEVVAVNPHAPLFQQNKVTMDVDSSGSPIIAAFSNPVRVFSRTNNTWGEIKSFPSPWGQPTLRVDQMGRTHHILSSTATAHARYLRWDSGGNVEWDQTMEMTGMISLGEKTDMVIDNANQAHSLVGKISIDPSGSFTPLPNPVSINALKLALVKNQFPFYVVATGQASPLVVLSTCIGGPPSQAQVVARSTNSLTWSFSPSTGAVLGHRLVRTSDGGDISGLLNPGISIFTETGMAPNQSSQIIVQAVFPGMIQESASGSTGYSLTVSPQNFQLTRLSGNSLSAHWESGGNISGTVYRLRLTPPQGDGVTSETTLQSAQQIVDPAIPYAVTLAAMNGNGFETFVSTLSRAAQDSAGPSFSFEIPGGIGVDISLVGPGSGPQLALAVISADELPTAPSSFGDYTPTGVGFNIPTNQAVPLGQTVNLTLRYPENTIRPSDTVILARYDSDRHQWVPLSTQWDTTARTMTAPTRALGLFQVMLQGAPPADVKGTRVYPNPFRPTLHGAMAIQEVPAGTRVQIWSDGGRLVREFVTQGGNATWDGRDADGVLAHSGVYLLRLERNGETKRVRFILER